ncbi:MAG TPA: HisA/HisF-related TIM barrel protein [Acidimicrobiales bacterium]|nr:HisA/HisF-related TIM barrel protein [Acidimicrobiales bacterium]
MELLPAIDLIDGGAVRLVQGDFGRVRTYGDPLALARRYVEGGAGWIHVVDLDAARTGRPRNRDAVLAIVGQGGARVQVGGGVRTEADATALLEAGVGRVVLGTVAVEQPEVVQRLAAAHPGRVAVGLDHRLGGEVAVRGWEQGSGVHVGEQLGRLAGLALGAVVITAIDRDGTLRGPDLDSLGQALAATDLPVVASGGIGGLADLRALAALAVEGRTLAGAIAGTALVEGAMSVEEAIAACAPSG